MIAAILTFLALALCACADPDCGPDRRKIGTVCFPIPDAEVSAPFEDGGVPDGMASSSNPATADGGAVADSAMAAAQTNRSATSVDAGSLVTQTEAASDGSDASLEGGVANADASTQLTCAEGGRDGSVCPTMTCQSVTCSPAGTCEYAATPGAACGNNLQCDVNGNCIRKPAMCGNGAVEAGEQCDDGNTVESDDCVDCQDAFCGDGYVRTFEECDPVAPGWNGKCNDICKRTVYELCDPAYSGACRTDAGTLLCGVYGHCVPMCGSEALTCPLVPGFDVECFGYTCAIRCSADGKCPSKMHCVDGNVCATETAREL